jgi:Fe-S cluster assembly protein SufD
MALQPTNKTLIEKLKSIGPKGTQKAKGMMKAERELKKKQTSSIKKYRELVSNGNKNNYWNNLCYEAFSDHKSSERPFKDKCGHLFSKISDVSINIVDGVMEPLKTSPPPNICISNINQLEEGVFLNYLNKTESSHDAFINLNNGMCKNGSVFSVEKSEIPQIIHINHIIKKPGIQQARQVFNIEPNAQVTFIETFQGKTERFENTISQWVIKENACVDKYSFGSRAGSHKKSQSVFTEFIEQHSNSACDFYSFFYSKGSLGFGGNVRNNIKLELSGKNILSNLWSVSLLNNAAGVDNNIYLKHLMPHCSSSQVFKGLFDGESKGKFDSCVYVAPNAQKSDTVQKNNNILIDDGSIINSNPQLEIFADDVKCAHGSTIGQIDNKAMFYMKSRGISESVAKKLLLSAFVGEVVEAIKNDQIKKIITKEIDAQFKT